MSSFERTLVFILGPTGSGKSAFALRLAEERGGEIISCDSMQVYRGFDIGTDKPSAEDRARVPHHLIDVADAGTQFHAADFAALALEAIAAVRERERIPLVVGGTGLYFKALEDGLFPGPGRDEAVRSALDAEAGERGPEVLWERLAAVDPAYAAKTGRRDRIRIVRALEVFTLTGRPISEHFKRTEGLLGDERPVKIGLDRPRADLYRRIEERVDRMFDRGLIEETRRLLAGGVPESAAPFKALGYKHVLRLLRGEIGPDEAAALTKIDTRHYAKRQMTWFRKMPGVRWIQPDETDPASVLPAPGRAERR
ncbi:MAG TPA: tRNA (adenosine(37)-N6)-dimethylallyltransferase MiaA [Candidatus Aminicenantes bacterium]|nr:tRNA (adenosine(37)-N6)-dimethylallyltransferase MiaA [Acidobacteriota bacterium]HOY98023.1 tRNA (adenosine(37)-N6)-dimethylallyltransferase MiaA [Candidatus Aminicenantes bacterium]HPH42967.1 tRNA (adenosine(37)-N6)-dimethylallyltransferase MiaA [Candidatus Aminicenantes bacterium]HPN16025.1 tRNA (adenosine(37)-N6)-dimethylallyltransferase MiaA [Candidatus Aminicenantes bacterium]